MAKLVPIILKVDGSSAKAEIRAVRSELRNLNDLTVRQAGSSQNTIFTRAQIAGIQRISRTRQQLEVIDARHSAKMAEISARGRISAENNAHRAIEAQRRRDFQEYTRIEREKTRIASAEAKKRANFGSSAGRGVESIGGGMRSAGGAVAVGVTAPIVAATYAIGEYGLSVEELRNQLTAFEGTAAKAESRLAGLRRVSDSAIGATREMTYSVYGLLKPLETISDETIDKTVAAMGRLKLGFKNMVPGEFAYNLTQVFGQNFEEQDIKQAIGQVPKFRQYLVQAFGTGDNEALRQMKASGKLTMDSFFQGIAEAVQNDQALAGLQEPVRLRMQKTFERLFEAVEPVANTLITILAKAIEYASPVIARLAVFFRSLSPAVQYVVVAFGTVAAALGPVLLAFGSLIAFIGSVVSGIAALGGFVVVAKAVGIALLAVVGIFLQLLPVIALGTVYAVALYKAWQTNFGGIRDFTLSAWNAIKSAVSGALNFIYGIVQSVGGAVVGWWRENYPLIEATVAQVSARIQSAVLTFLAVVQSFWETHGGRITAYVKAAWNMLQTTISFAMAQIGNIIKFAMQIINGDWAGAWRTVLDYFRNAARFLTRLVFGMIDGIVKYFSAAIPLIYQIFSKIISTVTEYTVKIGVAVLYVLATLPAQIVRLTPKFIAAGASIIGAIWQGIRDGLSDQSSLGLDAGVKVEFDSLGLSAGATAVNVDKLNNSLSNTSKTAGGAGKKVREVLTPIQQLRKDAAEARQSLNFLFGSREAQDLTAQIDNLNQQKSNLTELIKLRAKYGQLAIAQTPLPSDAATIEKDLEIFKKAEDGLKRANDMLIEYKNAKLGIGSEKTELEKVNSLIMQQGDLIDKTTRAKLREAAANEDRKNRQKEYDEVSKQIIENGFAERLQLSENIKLSQERLKLGRELTETEKQQINNSVELIKAETEWQKAGLSSAVIEKLRNTLLKEQADTLRLVKIAQEELAKILSDQSYKALIGELDEEIQALNVELGLSAELSRADAIAKQLQTEAYKNLTPEMRRVIIDRAKEIDALRAAKEAQEKYREIFEATTGYIEDKLQILRESGFKGLFKSLLQDLEDFLIKAAAKFLASKFLQYLQGKGLKIGGASGGGGNWLGNLLQIFTGGGAGGFGGGTPPFNPNLNFTGAETFTANGAVPIGGGGGMWGGWNTIKADKAKLGGIFGGGSGKMTLAGGLGLAGMAASVVGGMIGGRTGNVISMAGTGLSIGSMFGGPIGGAIGAGIGALVGLFMGDPKRKIDKKENMPKLQQGFKDAFREFSDLIADVNALRIDPESAMGRGRELRGAVASGFGIEFQSKKYRKQAQAQIAQQLAAIDAVPGGLMEQLKRAVDVAKAAGERTRRILPEFASGVFMDVGFASQYGDFKRRNGMLAGSFTGRDTLPSMLAAGEMVLNPAQMRRIRAAAGFDVFQFAGVPNYPQKAPGFADGVFTGSSFAAPNVPAASPNVVVQPNFTLVLEGVSFDENAKAYLESEKGERTIVKVVKKAKTNKEI